jgi:hypothetical protein
MRMSADAGWFNILWSCLEFGEDDDTCQYVIFSAFKQQRNLRRSSLRSKHVVLNCEEKLAEFENHSCWFDRYYQAVNYALSKFKYHEK